MDEAQPIPVGLCQCGCGQATRLAPVTNTRIGHVKGHPIRYIFGHAANKVPDHQRSRMEDRGYETPCQIWLLGHCHKGYGVDRASGGKGNRRAHIRAYERAYGTVPDGLEIDHLCRVRNCINPDHLRAVTHLENISRARNIKIPPLAIAEIYAAAERGNWQVETAVDPSDYMASAGTFAPTHPLTKARNRAIRQLIQEGHTQKQIAKRLGLNQVTISNISRGIRYSSARL